MSQGPALLQARAITKKYPGTLALDHVDFDVQCGAVNVLIGENGAGKSTLVKILAGVESPTSGSMALNGVPIRLANTRDADRHRIGVIYQELSLCPNLSVVENIFLGRELRHRGILVDRQQQHRIARELMSRLDQEMNVDTLVADLPLGRRQIVEIARALARDVQVLMMDEPTSALSEQEIRSLFRVIGELRAAGVGIVYISHKLEELMAIGDNVTVLRDGHVAGAARTSEIDVNWIIERMTGRSGAAAERRPVPTPAAPRLETRGLRVPGFVENVSFTLAAGEVVGIYGLMGAGRTELFEALAGARRSTAGTVLLDGERLDSSSLRTRLQRGLAMVPEDRQQSGLVPWFSVGQNITLASLRSHRRRGYLDGNQEAQSAARWIAELRIKATGPAQPIMSLSGGNQQKTLIARYLLTRPKVLLLDEPSRGVDVGARGEIFEIIRRLAAQGMAIAFSSSDLHEVLTLASRVLVMARGRITAEFSGPDFTEGDLVSAASSRPECDHARN